MFLSCSVLFTRVHHREDKLDLLCPSAFVGQLVITCGGDAIQLHVWASFSLSAGTHNLPPTDYSCRDSGPTLY